MFLIFPSDKNKSSGEIDDIVIAAANNALQKLKFPDSFQNILAAAEPRVKYGKK